MSKLENKPIPNYLAHAFRRNSPKQPENRFLMLFWGIWAPPNEPQKVLEGLQVDRMYVPISKLENKPLTKSLGPFL
jgi:hypothetical protein